jgi:tRNA splicing endonuclease
VLYQDGPVTDHADHVVWICPAEKEVKMIDLVAKSRTANHVKKSLMISVITSKYSSDNMNWFINTTDINEVVIQRFNE